MELDHKIIILIVAFLLDALLGDPRSIPHLIVLFGKLIYWADQQFNRGQARLLKGASASIILILGIFIASYFGLALLESQLPSYAVILVSVILMFYALANRTLINEGLAVFNTLDEKGLEAGRKRLSWIVGRDTTKLDAQKIRIATFETLAENLSDGVIAPLFYFLCFGVPGALAYKMINTLDSMIGYKNEKYNQFGKFAARIDDVANLVPARITAFLILLVSGKLSGIPFVIREGKNHSSPNAGYPEAALAYVLSCRFGGPNIYHGKRVEKPYIGSDNRQIAHDEIYRVAKINWLVSITFVIMGVALIGLTQLR